MLNADKYGELNKYSQSGPKEPGPFLSTFITGEPRDGQDVGKLQVMTDFDKKQYLVNNKSEMYFVIMFIKKYWERVVRKGDRDHTTGFGWNGEDKLDDTCKFKYIIAGLLLDPENKFAKMKRTDDPEKEALIYFKCAGVKFSSAMELTTAFAKKSEELTPLSDNMEFEKSVVTPRRYITKATVTTCDSNHGTKYTYKFEPAKKLADEVTVKFMDKSMETVKEFDKQFDKTALIAGGNSQQAAPSGIAGVNPSFEDEANNGGDTLAGDDADFQLDL
jgi:hypothetical protein